MEHYLIKDWFNKNNISDNDNKISKLSLYAKFIYEENKKYNLTGLKSPDEIVKNLIIGSLNPFIKFKSENYSSFVDVGTGSGIPGMVLGIFFEKLKGLLVDSNTKKINFLNMIIKELNVLNLTARCSRIEVLAHDLKYRDFFDFCVSRAFGPLYYSIEFGLPMLKRNGFLYIYSYLKKEELSKEIFNYIENLNGTIINNTENSLYGLSKEGLLIIKKLICDNIYPRGFNNIKRAAKKIKETINE